MLPCAQSLVEQSYQNFIFNQLDTSWFLVTKTICDLTLNGCKKSRTL